LFRATAIVKEAKIGTAKNADDSFTINANTKEKNFRRYLLEAKFTKGCNEYFPIPRLQIE